jgi:hypothetical protein
MRRILIPLLAFGMIGGLSACKDDAAEAPEATEEAPEQQTGTVERTTPDEQTGTVERTTPDEQTGTVERTTPDEQTGTVERTTPDEQ